LRHFVSGQVVSGQVSVVSSQLSGLVVRKLVRKPV
jgi:hypothetical protein